MSFTAKDVADLRSKTGCGMMDCKKALTQTNGDMDEAINVLREKGLAAATKKAGRIAAEGVAFAISNEDSSVAAVIEVNAETDFVAKNADFQNFVKICANTIIEKNPKDLDALLAEQAVGSDLTVQALLQEKILTIGENIKIRRFERYEGVVNTYVHAGGRIGVMLSFDIDKAAAQKEEFKNYAKDIAMQVAAINPLYLDEASVPADVLENERRILKEQVVNEGKPANIADKIVEGKLKKYFKENCLLDQVFVKNSDLTVAQHTAAVAKELNSSIKILDFVRFEKGEGLEKREDNFAEEVKNMIN